MGIVLRGNIDKPNFNLLYKKVQDSMNMGIRINIDAGLKKRLQNEYISYLSVLADIGIKDINSKKDIADKLNQLANNELIQGTNYVRNYCFDTSKNEWKTKVGDLKLLADTGNQTAIDLVVAKNLGHYISQIANLEEFVDDNDLLHPSIVTCSTNRLQYKNPALLGIAKPLLWNIIVPRSEDYSLYSIDVQNQEPWILINQLKIEPLRALISVTPDKGLYDTLYKYLYHDDPDKIERGEFKRSWNALTYGASKKAISALCHAIDSNVVYKFFKTIPNYKEYSSKMYALGNGTNLTARTYFGSEILIEGDTPTKRAKQLMNAGIQGTGADILAFLVENFDKEISTAHLDKEIRLYFTRHDEVILEVSKNFEEQYTEEGVIDILSELFEHRIDDWEPFRLNVTKITPCSDGMFEYSDNIIMDMEE